MYLFKGLKGQQFPNGLNIRFKAHEEKRILEIRLGLDLEGTQPPPSSSLAAGPRGARVGPAAPPLGPRRPPFILRKGARAAPHPLYKLSPRERGDTTIPSRKKESSLLEPSPLPAPSPLFSFVRAPLDRCLDRLRNPSSQLHAVVLLELRIRQIYFCNSAGSGKRKKSSSTVCVRNLRGVTLEALVVVPSSSTSSSLPSFGSIGP